MATNLTETKLKLAFKFKFQYQYQRFLLNQARQILKR